MLKLKSIFVISITAGGLCGCPKDSAPPAPQVTSLPEIVIKPRDDLLLTYFGGQGFETAAKVDDVPEPRRGWVRVVDLRVKPARRQDHELVYVADLRKPKGDGSFPYVVMSRRAFELAARSGAGGAGEPPARRQAGDKASSREVILYATSWCPACKTARRYLEDQRIPFVERDIEKDPEAAAELMRKAKAAGISASGVPVLDVGGTLMQGFDARRLSQLLAAINDGKKPSSN